MNTQAAADARQGFETIWEHVECGIAIIDAATREILDINPVAARMFGDDITKILGKRCHKFICPADVNSCPIMDKGQMVDRSERKFVKANGETIPIIKSVAKIQYNGRLALLESFTDISKLKEAEEKLLQLHVAEEASRSKSEFLSRMSHEMRTPMNAIIGMTKIAKHTNDIDKLKYCLSMIGGSATHLLGLINDVLDMAKIESGKFELDSQPFDLEALLKKISHLVQGQMEEKGLLFQLSCAENLKRCYLGDELRLSQIIINLLSNAVKFTPKGGTVSLTVEMVCQAEAASVLRFTVKDTGIGMSEDQVARLFNAFEQLDVSITRRFDGTGLGLVISKSIAEKMNGVITVQSTPGAGSTFAADVTLAHADCRPEALAQPGTAPDFSRVTLLLVEDVAINQEIFTSLLEDTGVRIICAENGQDAVAKFLANPGMYDCVIMDVQMPGMDGYEATKQIRAMDNLWAKTVPIIAMTANAMQEDVAQCLACGMDDHLAKPIDEHAVMEKILHYCHNKCHV